MRREAVAQPVDERAQRVDREPSLVEPGRRRQALGIGIRHEMEHRELPQPDGVVGDDVGDRHARQLGAGPQHLLDLLGARLLLPCQPGPEASPLTIAGCLLGIGLLRAVLS